ncbi:hypothetical protein BH09BAC5_BH09BAC5_05640 [soil metagenome]
MSYVRIWVHVVWGTKNRHPFLTKEIRSQVIAHICENAKSKEIFINRINGYQDHLHCLISVNAEMSISKMMQLMKGESAFWINKNKLTREKFEWADEYFAVSVSESIVERVRIYIDNQEEHHRKTTFSEEYEKFITTYGFVKQG